MKNIKHILLILSLALATPLFSQEKQTKIDTALGNEYYEKGVKLLETDLERSIIAFKNCLEHHPNRDSANYYIGYAYYFLDYLEESHKFAKIELEQTPDFIDAKYLLALTNSELGNTRESLQQFNALIKLDSNNVDYYSGRGGLYFKINEYKKAIDDLDLCLDIYPDLTPCLYLRSVCYYELGETDKALNELKKVIDTAPYFSYEPYYLLSKIYKRQGDTRKAYDYLDEAFTINESLKHPITDSEDYIILTDLILLAFELELYEQVVIDCELIIEYHSPLSPEYAMIIYPHLLNGSLLSYEFLKAEKYVNEFYENYSEHKEMYPILAAFYISDKNISEAKRLLEKGIERFPDAGELYLTLGDLLYDEGETDKAYNLLNKGVQKLQVDNPNHLLETIIKYQESFPEISIGLLTLALEKEPDDVLFRLIRFSFMVNNLEDYLSDISTDAEELIRIYKDRPKKQAAFYAIKALAEAHLLRFLTAEELASKAIELDEQSDYYLLRIVITVPQLEWQELVADIELTKSKQERLKNDIQQAIELNPNNADAYLLGGLVYIHIGEQEKACQLVKQGQSQTSEISIEEVHSICSGEEIDRNFKFAKTDEIQELVNQEDINDRLR